MFVEKVYNSAFALFNKAVDTFGDGFQMSDIVAIPEMWNIAKEGYDAIGPAVNEIRDITPTQVSEYVYDFTKKLLSYIKKDTDIPQAHDISATLNMIDDINMVIANAYETLKDGLQFDDINSIPWLTAKFAAIYANAKKVKLELSELNAKEISHIASHMVYTIYVLISRINGNNNE